MGAAEEALKIIEQGGPWLCSRDDRGLTPLMRLAVGAANPSRPSSADFERIAVALAPVGDPKAFAASQGSALMIAAKAGLSTLVQILAPWSDPRSHFQSNGTDHDALMLAAIHGHRGCVAILRACVPQRQDSNGRTALILAAQAQSHGCVAELAPCSDQEHRDSEGMTALAHAVRRSARCLDSVRALAKHGPSLLIGDGDRRPPLLAAIRAEQWEAALLLIPPCPDELGSPTPLMAALDSFRSAWRARSQSVDLLEIGKMIESIGELLAATGDDEEPNDWSERSAEASASNHLLLLIKALLPLSSLSSVDGHRGSIARSAVASGCEAAIAALAASRSIFEGNAGERCFASLAMIHGDSSAVFFLKGLWQDPPPSLDLGCPLATAISTQNFDWVERILRLPNPILGYDEQGFTPLMAATRESRFDLVKRLIPRSDLLALSQERKLSALMMAAASGQTEIAKILLTPMSRAQISGPSGPAAWICCANSNPETLAAILDPVDGAILAELSLSQLSNIQRMVQAARGNPKSQKCLSLIAPFFAPKALFTAQRHALRSDNAEVLEMLIRIAPPPDANEMFFEACAEKSIPCVQALWHFFDPSFRDSLGGDAMMRIACSTESDEFSEIFDIVRLLAPHVDLEARNYYGDTARDIFLAKADDISIDEDALQFLAFFDGLVEQRILGRIISSPPSAKSSSRRI